MAILVAINASGIALILLIVFLAVSGIYAAWVLFLILCVIIGIAFLIVASAFPEVTALWPIVPIAAVGLTLYRMYQLGEEPTGVSLTGKESEKQKRARAYADNVLKEAKEKKGKG
ncbi:MAG: hypothetical protein M1286_01460 [Candidatus Marsarchaeota archaeon]|nr:hypothetical protein [Candidatus Marsarchaeota archaeon]